MVLVPPEKIAGLAGQDLPRALRRGSVAIRPAGEQGWPNEHGPKDGYAVENEGGILVCFSEKAAALRFRLAKISRALDG